MTKYNTKLFNFTHSLSLSLACVDYSGSLQKQRHIAAQCYFVFIFYLIVNKDNITFYA